MQNIVIIADRDWIGVSDMNVLEKILEEIDKKADYYETDEQGREHVRMVDMVDVEEIIRSNMVEKVTSAEIINKKINGKTYYEIKYKNVGEDEYYIGYSSFNLDYVIEWLNGYFEFCGEAKIVVDVGKDVNVPSNDDMEEKIREHIAECLHRVDNIRSFIGSKEYTSNDEKCIRNIEVLKTSITALEEYLSSKKKNSNDGWIPVDERLPEVQEGLEDMYCPEFNVTIKGAEITTTLKYSWDGTWFDDYGTVYNVIAWQPLPEPHKGGDDRA